MTAVVRNIKNRDEAVWQARVDLAAACRIAARYDWNEGPANHFSMIVPGTTDRFLINPRGVLFSEVTASSLVVVDDDGHVVEGEGQVRPVAFRLHGHIHRQNAHAVCVLHVHPFYATTLAMVKGARLRMGNYTTKRWYDKIVYDDDMGGTVDDEECERAGRAFAGKTVMFHAAHGVTVVGPTVAEALDDLFFLERQCKQQFLAATYAAATGAELNLLSDEMCRGSVYSDGMQPSNQQVHFQALLRLLDREEPDYKD